MNNLLDIINQNAQLQKQGAQDSTAQARQLFAAKTGRQTSPGVATSNLGEQQAIDQTNASIGQVQQSQQIQQAGQQQQAAGIQQAAEQQRQGLEQAREGNQLQYKLQSQQLLNDLERDRNQLDLSRDRARLEQLGSTLALQDRQYVDTLRQEGQKRRLDDKLEFERALQEDIFGNSRDLLAQSLDNKSVLNASDREWKQMLADMDINYAMEIARREADAANTSQQAAAAQGLFNAAVGAYGTSKQGGFNKEYQTYKDDGGKATFSAYEKGKR